MTLASLVQNMDSSFSRDLEYPAVMHTRTRSECSQVIIERPFTDVLCSLVSVQLETALESEALLGNTTATLQRGLGASPVATTVFTFAPRS